MAERTVRIRFTGDAKGLVISSKKAETALDKFQDRVQKGFGGAVKAAVGFASKMGSAVAAAQAATGAAAGLATAGGALLALPAGAAAYAAVMGAVKLGIEGAERAQERFVERTKAVREAVAESYEKALNPAVDTAARILNKLRPNLQGIVTEIGGMAQAATRTAALPANMKVLNQVTGGTRGLMADLKASVAPLTQAFIDLVSVAAPGLGTIGNGVGAAATKFAKWIRRMRDSGELAEKLKAGIDKVVDTFWTFVIAGQAIVGIFSAISEGAGGVGGVMGPVLTQVRDFVQSTEGQTALRAFGAALAQVGNALSTVLGAALRAVAPLIEPLATLFGAVASAVADLVTPIIDFLAPGLEAIAGWIKQNTDWLGPLITAVVAFTAVSWLLNAALNANPIMLIIGFIALLIVAFISLWKKSESFRNFFIGTWNAIKKAAGAVADWFVGRWNDVMGFFRGIPGFFSKVGTGISEGIKSGFKSAVNWIIGQVNGLIRGINWLIDGINVVNPFGSIPHIPQIPGLARGGTLLRGGLVEVGERGREIVRLPAGAQVSSKTDSDAMIAAAGGGGDVHVYLNGEPLEGIVDRVVRSTMRGGARRAAMAPGGAW